MQRAREMVRRVVPAALCVSAALALAACGGDDKPAKQDDGPAASKQRLTALEKRLGDGAAIARTAGCTISTPTELEPEHVGDVSDVDYSSDPPSSGPHVQDWAPWGFYDEPVEDGYVVHNLEHGGVALWYAEDALDDERRTVLRDEVLDDTEKWIVTPREDLDGIATAAWGMLMTCDAAALDKLDEAQFTDLLDAWYDATNSQGTEVEKDVPSYAGAMAEPQPDRDISRESPESFEGE
jgi:Protein of unknown function (DUF3105)